MAYHNIHELSVNIMYPAQGFIYRSVVNKNYSSQSAHKLCIQDKPMHGHPGGRIINICLNIRQRIGCVLAPKRHLFKQKIYAHTIRSKNRYSLVLVVNHVSHKYSCSIEMRCQLRQRCSNPISLIQLLAKEINLPLPKTSSFKPDNF